ncbi:hypothetical protein SAMN04488020_108189 [Palleronia marisminoris]|uniref:Uncharacterized protein n=2 Tax=Palleronia marisminoris TaxID=315423 RepID=A0A1Y5TF79_9RHOB|nr:hypothetical protein [Palleronia marisminoris]SFH24702.1 hypothetical protein SAMN04488020_108189 [Palleronia marisminoris]SLN58915.1 hypothetical protein PAM7066_02897 [Palleronia marisminoris]
MNVRWLLRAKRWAQNPPSEDHVKLVLTVIVACVSLYLVDLIWGWPDWLSVDQSGRRVR